MPWVYLDHLATENPATKKEIDQILEYRRRKAKAKYYSDENFPAGAVQIVRSSGLHVLTAQEASLRGHPDENHVAFALKNHRILLTCDRDYLDEQRFPLIHCPVIVVCNFGSGSPDEMRQVLRCLRTMSTLPQVYDKWTKVDAKRDSWTEFSRFLEGVTSKARYRLYRGYIQEWVD